MTALAEQVFTYQQLKVFAKRVFEAMGCPAADARKAAEVLLSADLRGVDSHGVARLSGYVRLWKAGRVNPSPQIKVVHETPSTATIDGDAGLGLVIAPKAMELAMEKALQCGSGWVSVCNSNHFGIAGYHAMLALGKDMTGIAMTNASPLVAPAFSKERMLGTNPVAVAVPAGEEPPFVADMATSAVANGKLEVLERQYKEAPEGWIQDKNGSPATDPEALKQGGALLPLGSDPVHGSHKGYCLGAIVDIFSAIFSGANYGPWVPPFVSFLPVASHLPGNGIGHFLGAIRMDAFRPAEEFKQHMDQWIRRFRQAETIAGKDKVLIPGDPEREMEMQRIKKGIPLLSAVVEDLQKLSKEFSIEL